MKRMVWLAAVAVAAVAASYTAATQGEGKDKAQLQGKWELTKVQFGDKDFPLPAGEKTTLEFKGDKVTAKSSNKPDEEGNYTLVDEKSKPKQIDMKIGKEGVAKCIYELTDDTLKVGMSIKGPMGDRPTGFDGKEMIILTLKKAK